MNKQQIVEKLKSLESRIRQLEQIIRQFELKPRFGSNR